MKKIFLVALVVLLFTAGLQAQFLRGYGVKVGGTIANQVWDYSTNLSFEADPDSKIGFNIGGFIEFLDIPFFSIVGELNYVNKGVEEEIPVTTAENPGGTGATTNWSYSTDYLNISALAKLRMNLVVISPYIVAGPKLDIELNRSIDSFEGSNLEDEISKGRFGFKVGAGTEINLVVVNLLAEFIYDFDFNPLVDTDFLDIKTNSFDFRLGIYF